MLLQSNGPDLPSIQVLEDYFLGSVREDMSEREKEYKLLKVTQWRANLGVSVT